MVKVLIIIPCFNEQDNIVKTLSELKSTLINDDNVKYDIIVINDCSTDNSIAEINKTGTNHIDLPINLGIGGAMQTGYMYAKENDFDIAIQLDGDGQHDPNFISNIVQPIINGDANIVIGSRFVSKVGFQSTSLRRVGIRYFSWLNNLLVKEKILDSTSGFRALDKEAINGVCNYYPEKYPEPESIIQYALSKFKILEVPVEMRAREGGVSSITGLKSLFYMFKVTLGTLFLYIRLKSTKQ